jgi:BirA family biotin operon repressor/biotin-[acetyl-CoA-carboxylase] ligase
MMQDKIIHFLKESQNVGYLSGEEISRHLRVSHAGIWKYIQGLRKEGYDIVAVPHLGYRLISPPDRLLPHEIHYGLGTRYLGGEIIYEDAVTSTMDMAFQMGMKGAVEGTIVCAEGQTQGKGRLGRRWHSPKGKGIYMSVLLRPPLPPAKAAQLTLLAAVAVCEAIRKVSRVAVGIKWPNDILVNNRKLAGILTELSAETDRVRFVVVGIGVNVNTPLSALPPHATSLKEEISQKVSRVELLQEILRFLEAWYETLKGRGFAPVVQRWKELSLTLGRRIRVMVPGSPSADPDGVGEMEGEAVDIDEVGGLLIRDDSGVVTRRISGDVIQIQ